MMYLLRERIGNRISQQAAEDIIYHMLNKVSLQEESIIMKSAIQDKVEPLSFKHKGQHSGEPDEVYADGHFDHAQLTLNPIHQVDRLIFE